MNPVRLLSSIVLFSLSGLLHAQGNPITEAINRGIATNRSNVSPKTHEMTPAEWRRQQIAAMDKSEEILRDAKKRPGLLAQYAHMQQNYDSNSNRAFRLIFGQYLSWYQTWIADYNAARATFSIAQPAQPDDAPSPLSAEYRTRPADETILELTKDRRAVFFNEAHSAPLTRTLTVELLAALRKQGFTHFAAETLYGNDKNLQTRGYPTAASGFYVDEPIYGEMVRTAIQLGYQVVAYDAEDAGAGDAREKGGARALYEQVFKHDPNARLVVNAGFGHIQKAGVYLGGSSMAQFFKKLSDIDPLCIEQTMMIEHARSDQDHPYYIAAAAANTTAKRPFVYVDGNGKPWSLKPDLYDLSVFFPLQKDIDGRPDWIDLNGARIAYPVDGDACRNQFPCLIEAHYANEGDDGIAADRVVLNIIDEKAPANQRILQGHGIAQGRLYLRPGRYRLLSIDRNGHTLANRGIAIADNETKSAR